MPEIRHTNNDMGTEVFKLDHVSKIFESKDLTVRAVDDVSLVIEEGEIFGIIGMSGAGKSTLVRTLNRLEEINTGTILYYGQDMSKLSNKELNKVRQTMPMIFQGFNLMMQKTVLANVMLPLKIAGIEKKRQKEIALENLKIVGLEEKASSYPAQLSGGQKQRVAIARALTVQPKVLLCDEATSALDPKITDEILSLLKRINKEMGLTVIIITHEMSVIEKICNRVAIIDHGKMVEVGDVQQIFTSPKSEAAKRLILRNENDTANAYEPTSSETRVFRLVFDGVSSKEPMIAHLSIETGKKLNILSANTKTVGGTIFGQMIVELPDDQETLQVVTGFFEDRGVVIKEVE